MRGYILPSNKKASPILKTVFLAFQRAILTLIITTAFLPVPTKASAPETLTQVSINIDNLYEEPVKVVSLPEVKQPEPQPKPAPRRNLTVNSTVSGDRYGNAVIVSKDTQYFNCVSYVKAKTGIYRSLGNGARSAIQGKEPRVGSIGAMRGRAHAVYVTAVNGEMVTFTESNYMRGYITQRTAPVSMFLGFAYN